MLVLSATPDITGAGLPGQRVQLQELIISHGHILELAALGNHGQHLPIHSPGSGGPILHGRMTQG